MPVMEFISLISTLKAIRRFIFFLAIFLPGQENPDWPHLNPETAARIAVEAQSKKLVLVHFGAHKYDTVEKRQNAEHVAQETFKNTTAGKDNMEFII